jgi:hypothetical protein
MVWHVYNPSTREAGAGGSYAWGQAWFYWKFIVRPWLKRPKKKDWGRGSRGRAPAYKYKALSANVSTTKKIEDPVSKQNPKD